MFDAQGLGSRYATKRFLRKVDEIRPDLVHIHAIHGCFMNYPLLFNYLYRRDIPVIWTLHDCWAITGHCVHFERTGCDQWKTQCAKCLQKHDFPVSFFLDRCKRNYSLKRDLLVKMRKMHITTVSQWMMGVVEQSFLKEFPIRVVPNGINTDDFKYSESTIKTQYNIGDKKLILAVASGFGKRKGIIDFAALSQVLSEEYQLLLVGVNDNDIKVLPKNIIPVKRANGVKELTAFYSAADVLLSLSYEETFGLTIIEAMACGTPAIVYANTAQPELITESTGMVVPNGDLDGIKRAIESICARGKTYYSSACREHAKEYDERKTYRNYLDLYSRVSNQQV